jgi:hypothetical protein
MALDSRPGNGWIAACVASASIIVVLLSLQTAPAAALHAEPAGARETARIPGEGPGRFYRLKPATVSQSVADTVDSPVAADFSFDKRVMLTTDFQQTQSCAGSVDALTVNYGASVTYCYYFANTGTTTFVTHTLTDDKLGGLGPEVFSVSPGNQVGFIGRDPASGVTSDVTNIATWTAVDTAGASISRTDAVTVRVLRVQSWLPLMVR